MSIKLVEEERGSKATIGHAGGMCAIFRKQGLARDHALKVV
jgi:hypothetical protein